MQFNLGVGSRVRGPGVAKVLQGGEDGSWPSDGGSRQPRSTSASRTRHEERRLQSNSGQ